MNGMKHLEPEVSESLVLDRDESTSKWFEI